ncbi:MAG: RNA polymerase sigma factor [Candidatus Zixiibacteriota bacterium]|nr:MAG: RNA polymerase sigma factor [candidate division Zixibacteria bacterium]
MKNVYLTPGQSVLNKPETYVYIDKEEKTDEDRELILQLKRGKMKAFRKLVEKYKKPAFFIALGLVGNREDAYDISQEAFTRVYTSLGRFNPQHKFFSWFYAILSNLCKNHLRSREIRGRYIRSVDDDAEMSSQTNPAPGPDVLMERNERSLRLWEEISELPLEFKEIIILKHFQGYSYKEISQMLNIPLGSVMSRLYYARKKLKDNLKDILT